jgi:hypothetical protein
MILATSADVECNDGYMRKERKQGGTGRSYILKSLVWKPGEKHSLQT